MSAKLWTLRVDFCRWPLLFAASLTPGGGSEVEEFTDEDVERIVAEITDTRIEVEDNDVLYANKRKMGFR